MKLTLEAEDVRRFRQMVTTLIGKPKTAMAQFVVYRNKSAMTLDWYGWMLVMPIRGRKPLKPFRIPLAPLLKVAERTEGKINVRIDEKKELGVIEGVESSGFLVSHPFPVHSRNWKTDPIPEEFSETKTFSTSWLSALVKCSRIASNHRLATIRITPDGEFGATDGRRMLLVQTATRFPWQENVLVRATEFYGNRQFRECDSFKLGIRDGWVCFDFGDCRFFTKPDVGHYPDLHKILPKEETIHTRLQLDPKDMRFLKEYLPTKKSDKVFSLLCDFDNTVLLYDPETNKAVRLTRSRYEGDACVLQTKACFLQEAFSFHCLNFQFGDSYPTATATGTTYCWMPDEMPRLPLESDRPNLSTTFVLSDQPDTQ